MSADLKSPFGQFIYDAMRDYRASCGGQVSPKMWVEKAGEIHDAWHKARRRPRNPRVANPQAEAIYELYPRKVGRQAALRAIIRSLDKIPADVLEERVKLYASLASRYRREARQFIPYPETWFNQARYDDDPNEWRRPDMAPESAKGPPEPAEPAGWLSYMRQRHPDWIEFRQDGDPTWAKLGPLDRRTVADLIGRGA